MEEEPQDLPASDSGRRGTFVTTHWSVVAAAGGNDSVDARDALEHLCRTYWYPLYAFVRRRGYGPEDAQDLTQDFFSRLLEHRWVQVADPAKGRFRTFLLTALTRFLANEWDKATARKRGGGHELVPFDTAMAESRYQAEPTRSADQLYDRQWAITLLESTLSRLGDECRDSGKTAEFETLSPWLTSARGEVDYPGIASGLGITEVAARQALHRLRKRFRELFREQILQTVSSPGEADQEIRHLLSALE